MKILIINPNSDPDMTESIRKTAENYAGGEFEIDCRSNPGAPVFIETYEDIAKAAPGLIQQVRENEPAYDAFIIACHDDPHLDVIKEITNKPVVGIGEASMKIASMLGHRFSVLSTSNHSIPFKEAQAREYHLQEILASVRAPEGNSTNLNDEETFLSTAKKAVEEDNAEVIVLGCAGLSGLDKKIQKKLHVPVLDGVICALIIAQGLVKYRVSTSKKRRYNPEC
jgi:allantoin racemase